MIGLHFEELDIGRVIGIGNYTFTADNISRFSRTFVPVSFHLDSGEAEKGLFGGTAAAGFHTCCAWMICFVTCNDDARKALAATGMPVPEPGPSPGVQDIRWPRPVHPGDVVSFRNTITDKRELASRPQWGMITMLSEGHNQRGELVMSFSGKVLVARKG
ncbi:MAG: MaoC family dehydratase N-terminal domain-containing protein [Proteobacteria bacterium]|nr:MaoC family dehydratase N-terminal domain-containing protein [Pseudomonadota bacterium]